MTPFLELATHNIHPSSREEIHREFLPKLEAVRDGVEFDLLLWSLAQRLAVDTEELLRKIGETWLVSSDLMKDILARSPLAQPLDALRELFMRIGEAGEAPLPGIADFTTELTTVGEDRIKISCEGARRCCAFLEGMARALCEAFGVSVRYLRQPKRATHVLITFSCIAS